MLYAAKQRQAAWAFGPNRPLALMKVVFILLETMARLSSPKKRKYGNSAKLSVKTEIRLSESASETIGPMVTITTNQII